MKVFALHKKLSKLLLLKNIKRIYFLTAAKNRRMVRQPELQEKLPGKFS